MSWLPSLGSLKLLALAAQYESLSLAADKAGMTQSAASRRMAALENVLGFRLLMRHRRGVALTAAGANYLRAIEPALLAIEAATSTARATDRAEPLRLRVYSTFATRWLLPRLPDFQADYPEIEVRLDTTVAPVVFGKDKMDIAIQFGDGRWRGLDAQPLIGDLIEPVCSPAFAQKHADAIAGGRLSEMPLLHSRYRRLDWRDWAAAAGLSLTGARRLPFPSSLLTDQAAIEGLGVAVAQTRFLSAELEAGALVRPFARALARDAGYFLVSPRGPEPARVTAFRHWIGRRIAD